MDTVTNQPVMDYDLHGIVRVRFIGAPPAILAGRSAELGTTGPPPNHEPDIVVRFEELSPPRLHYLGLGTAAFDDDGFYLLSRNNRSILARIPFEHIGERSEIVCQSGLGSVPFLSEIIRLTLVKKNHVPVHASAFVYQGAGILVMGWTKGGKTETLLSFANHGAQYIGDEWVVLSHDGHTMFGLPVSVTLREWQFKYIPKLMPRIAMRRRILFKGVHFVDAIYNVMRHLHCESSFLFEALDRVIPQLKDQLKIREFPQAIFGPLANAHPVRVDKIILAMSHTAPEVTVTPCDPMEIARRMVHSNTFEHRHFLEYYRAFRFAFPHLRNAFLESVDERQTILLCRALEGKEAYKISHPYPVPLEDLFYHLRCHFERKMDQEDR